MAVATIHDARTGFHDVKAAPAFHPFPVDVLCAAVILFACCAIFFLYRRRRKQIRPSEPGRPPIVVALSALAELEAARTAGTIELRELALRLSATIRQYLEAELGFPAAEETSKEVVRNVRRNLEAQLPLLPQAQVLDYTESCRNILRSCDYLSFSIDAGSSYSLVDERLAYTLARSSDVVGLVAAAVQKERARKAALKKES